MLMLLSVHVTRVLFLVLAGKFCPDYGLLLELHALTLVARSYALLDQLTAVTVLSHIFIYMYVWQSKEETKHYSIAYFDCLKHCSAELPLTAGLIHAV